MLAEHLASCAACQQYADSLSKMESVLRPLLQRQWTQQPVPFPMGAIISRESVKNSNLMILTTRIAAIGVMFMIFVFSAWQLTISRTSSASPIQANVPLIPIPSTSTQLVATNTENGACEETVYVVQENDTLASIAARFGITKAELAMANHMTTEIVRMGTKLIVPLCQPTQTINTLTKTFTPVLNTITSTPGG